MSLANIMTSLMNGFRSKYALQNKLSLGDATTLINKLDMGTRIEGNFSPNNNNSNQLKTDDGVRFVCINDDSAGITGAYFYYDQKLVVPGKRYTFNALIKGTMTIKQIGPEGPTLKQVNQALDSSSWSLLTVNFIARRNFVIYCTAKSGDWLELKDWQFLKLGEN